MEKKIRKFNNTLVLIIKSKQHKKISLIQICVYKIQISEKQMSIKMILRVTLLKFSSNF